MISYNLKDLKPYLFQTNPKLITESWINSACFVSWQVGLYNCRLGPYDTSTFLLYVCTMSRFDLLSTHKSRFRLAHFPRTKFLSHIPKSKISLKTCRNFDLAQKNHRNRNSQAKRVFWAMCGINSEMFVCFARLTRKPLFWSGFLKF